MAKGTGDRTFLHDIILDIIKDSTPERPIQKKQIIERLKQQDIELSRTTLDKKLFDLENKGYRMVNVGRKGFYLEKNDNSLTDGELRLLIDTIMYSRIIPEDNAHDMIIKLSNLGSSTFEKAMNKRAYSAQKLDKDAYWGTIENVEIIQKAIFEHKQISCNYITVIDYNMKYRFEDDIVVNPYELAFSGGKYFMLCSYENDEDLEVLRLDKLDHLELLKSKCVENKALEKIKNEKGIQQYLYNQPELKGGQPIDIDLLCYNDALYEVYDDFGKQNTRIKTVRPENYDDPDTTLISVRTTREAMKSWAVFHADSIVVVKPQDLRDEIVDSLKIAQHTYLKTGKSAMIRSRIAKSLDEAIREMKNAGKNIIIYSGHYTKHQPEKIDLSKYDISGLRSISFSFCNIFFSNNYIFSDITSITLIHCDFSTDIFEHFPNLQRITIADSDISDLAFLKNYPYLHELRVFNCDYISGISNIFELKELKRFESDLEEFDEKRVKALCDRFPECRVLIREKSERAYRKEPIMAVRPTYYLSNGKVISKDVRFEWFAGFSSSQKQKSIASFHEAIKKESANALPLEISTKSTEKLGNSLSAFKLHIDGHHLENVFQSSKIFENGGPYRDLLDVHPKDAKRDERLGDSGAIIGFNYDGKDFPTEPKTLFYDYIYIKAVKQSLTADEIKKIAEFTHFTDIEFNPRKSINTQAKSVAIIKLMLDKFGEIPDMSIDEFIEFHKEFVKA